MALPLRGGSGPRLFSEKLPWRNQPFATIVCNYMTKVVVA
jgi:hypothetical protein